MAKRKRKVVWVWGQHYGVDGCWWEPKTQRFWWWTGRQWRYWQGYKGDKKHDFQPI